MKKLLSKKSIFLMVAILFVITMQTGCAKEETKAQSVVADIPFETVEEIDESLAPGERRVITPGENGFKRVTFEVRLVNGKETSKKVVSKKIIKKPVNEVVAVGPVE